MRLRLESLDENARRKIEGDLDEIESLATSALDATRALAADEPLTRVDLAVLAQKLRDDFAQMTRTVVVEGSAAPIEARPMLLRRALVNAIDNALKYGTEVVLRLEDGSQDVRIHVLDRGPGIPADELEKVLYPFYRVESSRNRETGGAGLGLAIAKDVAEGHGGTLQVANRPDGGLRVTFVLPR
jgi:protein-histidine pros-kinase